MIFSAAGSMRSTCIRSMRVDPLLKTERATLRFEAIGGDEVGVNASSWDNASQEQACQTPCGRVFKGPSPPG